MPWPFWGARLPSIGNALQGAKYQESQRKKAVEEGRINDADEYAQYREDNFNAASKQLVDARQETLEEIRKRDAGESREPEDGRLW